jgi:Holliday junction DNA helicase RuvB
MGLLVHKVRQNLKLAYITEFAQKATEFRKILQLVSPSRLHILRSMAIQSSKPSSPERIVTPKAFVSEGEETRLRPSTLDEYIGQSQLKKHLSVAISSAKIRSEPLEHILFYGPPGLGKTTLSQIIAREMGAELRSSSGPAIEKQADIISLLTSLKEHDILFIDEIHRLKPNIEEILY